MGKALSGIILGTAIILLSHFVFGSGLLTRFTEVLSILTSMQNVQAVATGQVNAENNVTVVIKFIIEVAIYYIASALIVFGIGLFTSSKKKEEKK